MSWSRLVIRTRQPGLPGSRGRTWLGRPSVVEDDQDPLVGQLGAVESGGFLDVGRNPVGSNAQRTQELLQDVGRLSRCRGCVAAQVDVQLPVGKPVGDLVRPVHGQGGLADPAGPGDRHDRDRTRSGRGVGRQRVEPAEISPAAGEVGDVGGQLTGKGRP